MNTITLLGRTTSQIELKQTPQGKSVASFSIAVKRPFSKDTTDFFTIQAWGKQAELIAQYVKKGEQICIRGYLTNRTWQDKQGQKRVSTEVVADEVSFVGSKESTAAPTYQPYVSQAQFEEVPNDGSLPF